MRKIYLTLTMLIFFFAVQFAHAQDGIALKFLRSGTDSQSVKVSVADVDGAVVDGAGASIQCSHDFKATAGNVTEEILCPNVNGSSNPTIEISVSLSGLPANFSFNTIGLDIHALNGANSYQQNNDNKVRKFNVALKQGATKDAQTDFGSLSDIDVAAGIGAAGSVHQLWTVAGGKVAVDDGALFLTLTITAGSQNDGCFFGLSEIQLTTSDSTPEPEPEPEPEPNPDDSEGKIYNIQWKNTGTNYITENEEGLMYISDYDVTKYQFWQFIPTGNENCYYIKNTATGNYMGSCNLTPSSASRVTTTTKPVEYYVAPTAATSGEIAGCFYFSSTDCSNYNVESKGPRALNKDGASNYVITWQAGTSRVGSYWKLIETEDLYEIRPFEPSATIGSIEASYNILTVSGKCVALTDNGPALSDVDIMERSQEWYFVGSGGRDGWQIASVEKPATLIGLSDGELAAAEGLTTKWGVNVSKEVAGFFYFTDKEQGTVLKIEGDSLFKFSRMRSLFSRQSQIYNNPCGRAGSNYLKNATITGRDVLQVLAYSATSRPANWHVVYAHGKAIVATATSFDLNLELAFDAAEDLVASVYFDWNADGVFETSQQLAVDTRACTAKVEVPAWASSKQARMRVRLNSNGLNLAEDDVEGYVYDFMIATTAQRDNRIVTLSVNDVLRGSVSLSAEGEEFEYGVELTATATTKGNSNFVCWRQGSAVVSTDASYTFNVNGDVRLTAYFSPNTEQETGISAIELSDEDAVVVEQQGSSLVVTADSEVSSVDVYTVGASLAAHADSAAVSVAHLSEGVYIVRVTTTEGYRNIKIYINN